MSDPGFQLFSCLCGFILAIANILWMIIGIVFLTIGALLSNGAGAWLISTFNLSAAFESLSRQLNSQFSAEIDVKELFHNVSAITGSAGAAFILLGASLVLIAMLGCCGICCKSRLCLAVYLIIVSMFFFAQLLVVILWFANSETFKSTVKRLMEDSLRKYTGINSLNVESLLQNALQIYAGCCGVNNGSDFRTLNEHWDRRYHVTHYGKAFVFNLTYPVSCCQFDLAKLQLRDKLCPLHNTMRSSNHHMGCYHRIFAFIQQYFELNYIFYALAGIIGIQALLIAGTLVLYHDITSGGNKIHPAV